MADPIIPARVRKRDEFTLVLRPYITIVGPEGDVIAPLLPASLGARALADHWVECFGVTAGDTEFRFYCRRLSVSIAQTRALFFVAGPPGLIARIEANASIRSWDNFAALRADAGAIAVAVKNTANWIDERPFVGGVRTGERIALYSCLAGFEEDTGE